MESDSSLPGTPAGGPLQAMPPERANMQRDSIFSSLRSENRDSSVHDKINQFNTLSVALQSKQLERKTADAALKRAMVGREEAEAEMRRYKDEVKALLRAIEEGKERERRVGERLETVMENYGRAKETHAHTQALWEKEIRRARKETFKTQSSTVKVQEELKSARTTIKALEESLDREKERSRVREQEAFAARYQIVGVQEQLEQALERIKLVEQERDAFKTAAKNEEVARIAAEGRIPLPKTEGVDDEFASPRKPKRKRLSCERASLTTMEIASSAATELELEDLNLQVQWERQRADRAQSMVEFLQAECELHCCPCTRNKQQIINAATQQTNVDAVDDEPMVNEEHKDDTAPHSPQVEADAEAETIVSQVQELPLPRSKKEPRRSTIFCPQEGIFRTVSEAEAELLNLPPPKESTERVEEEEAEDTVVEEEAEVETVVEIKTDDDSTEPPTPGGIDYSDTRMYARTPSVEPPSFAMLAQERVSLMSLLNAPHGGAHTVPVPSIPVQAAEEPSPVESPEPRPHTSAAAYAVTTTTTTVPIRDEKDRTDSSFGDKLRTPSTGSFDLTNPALTPTMTREQALAKIRERRGRARSVAQGSATPHKKMLDKTDRRHMSAPTGRSRA
ncbi:hypothetical protein S40285_01958 [Stachybotrys chlorohalonatus IBT 40285]|uniref:Uncharacterized protein n=1 Tax=Stachybotrys chlorohalonatus (strain IBT 40285) TaxID=1283841 RepID=A0A084QII5_STAC4|nr:hypothetical protein S40285_01958 [Stachybotrys chlorohalonata IBT 40285]